MRATSRPHGLEPAHIADGDGAPYSADRYIVRILILDSVAADAELELSELDQAGFVHAARRVQTEPDFRRALGDMQPDVILADLAVPRFDGLAALVLAREISPATPFIFVSATGDEKRAAEALMLGATDFVPKSGLARLVPAVRRALREADARETLRRAETVAQISQSKYESLVNAIDGIVWEMEIPDLRFRFVSRRAEPVLGHAVRAWLEQPDFWVDHLHPDDRSWVPDYCRLQAGLGNPFGFEFRMRALDGRIVWLRSHASVVAESGPPVKLVGVMVDVTESRRRERSIARLNRVHAMLSGISAATLRAGNRQELLDEACRIAMEEGGYRGAAVGLVDAATGRLGPLIAPGVDRMLPIPHDLALEALNTRRPLVIDGRAVESDPAAGSGAQGDGLRAIVPLSIDQAPVGVLTLDCGEAGCFRQEEIRLLGHLATDLSFGLECIDKRERLEHLAYYDPLTGLPNRSLFPDRLGQALRAAGGEDRPLALILVDLVNFKLVNDSLGKNAGDAALRAFAERLRDSLPPEAMLARVAGDVFAFALPGGGPDVTQPIIEQVLGACEPDLDVAGHPVRMYVKLGVAVFPGDGIDAEALYRNAETALKKAKRSIEPALFYSPEMNPRVSELLTIRNKLRRALTDQQFVLHLQPILDLPGGGICGAEALVRWNDPQTGMVPPAQFIPLLEETGMILDLGRWVIEEAQSLYTRWHTEGLKPPRISVNVSAIQLRHRDFVKDLVQAMAKGPAPGTDIEITESVMMDDVERNARVLSGVREMGVGIAIDDFGTGYSSLNYLARLPIHALKIDRAFIMNLVENPNDVTLVTTIISLARALDLKVVAEGVESVGQSSLLKLLRCDMMQGHLYSRALPVDDFEKLLKGTPPPLPV